MQNIPFFPVTPLHPGGCFLGAFRVRLVDASQIRGPATTTMIAGITATSRIAVGYGFNLITQ